MRQLRGQIDKEPYVINFVETYRDAAHALMWCYENPQDMSLDTEANTWDIHEPGWFLRLFQFGDKNTSWVIPIDKFWWTVQAVCRHPRRWIAHNAPHDVRSLDAWNQRIEGRDIVPDFLLSFEDTYLASHLYDSRSQEDGGIGHGLKDLAVALVDSSADDGERELKVEFKKILIPVEGEVYKSGPRKGQQKMKAATLTEGWGLISIDNEAYIRYSGLDPILNMHVKSVLYEHVGDHPLLPMEHQLQYDVDKYFIRPGFLLDVPYTEELSSRFGMLVEHGTRIVQGMGLDNMNSPQQVVQAFLMKGAELTKKTDSGALSADSEVLIGLAKQGGPVGDLAKMITWTKRMAKAKSAWIDNMLRRRDANDRVHPGINTLTARTARMSADNPNTQNLPADDPTIRDCAIADPGYAIISSDYDQVEMRIVGELSGEQSMIEAAQQGRSMHDLTAELMYGPVPDSLPSWKDADPRKYKLSKVAGFASVYGGGADVISEQTGEPLSVTRGVVAMFRKAYPAMNNYKREVTEMVLERAFTGKQLAYYRALRSAFFDTEDPDDKAELKNRMYALCRGNYGWVITPSGRKLYVDAERAYSGTNYIVQETARHVLAEATIRMCASEIAGTLLLLVHDEVLGQDLIERAEETAERYGQLMTVQFGSVPLTAKGAVFGRSWGEGYRKKVLV